MKNLYSIHDDPVQLIGYENRMLVPDIVYQIVVTRVYFMRDQHDIRRYINSYRDVLGKVPKIAYDSAKLCKDHTGSNLWDIGSPEEFSILQSDYSSKYLDNIVGKDISRPRYADILVKMDPIKLSKVFGRLILWGQQFDESYREKVLNRISENTEAALTYANNSGRRIPSAEDKIRNMSQEEWNALEPMKYNIGYQSAWEYYLSRLGTESRAKAVQADRARQASGLT